MAFSVSQPGGWFDIPDSVWQGDVIEDHLVALNSLIRFAAVCDEYMPAAPQRNGDTVALGVSADDGYGYSRSEVLYAWSMQSSPNHQTGLNGGPGNIILVKQFIDQDTGAVSSVVDYYVQGHQETASTDGLISVLLCCRRGAGSATVAVAAGTGGGPAGGGGGIGSGVSPFQGAGSGGGDPQGTQGDGGQGDPRPVI